MVHSRISLNLKMKCVRVWEGGRKAVQTYFTVKEYGSMDNAFDAASAYEENLPAWQRTGRIAARTKPYANSQSGIVGVCPIRNRAGEEAGWRANWTQEDRGQRQSRTRDFSFHAYGTRAFHHAIECRDAMVQRFREPDV